MQETHTDTYLESGIEDTPSQDNKLPSDFYHMSVIAPKAERPMLRDMSKALAHEQKLIKAIGGKAFGMHYNLKDLREAVVVWYFEGKVPDMEPNPDARDVLRNGDVSVYSLKVFNDILGANRFRRTSNGNYLKELDYVHYDEDGSKKRVFVFLV